MYFFIEWLIVIFDERFFNEQMPVGAVLLHVSFDISSQNLLVTIWAGCLLVLPKVLSPDVSLAV